MTTISDPPWDDPRSAPMLASVPSALPAPPKTASRRAGGDTGPQESIRRSPAWSGWQAAAKRALDIAGAICLLLLLAPVMALVAIAIRLDSAGPAIFRQTRCGKDGKPFTCFKFRGMVATPRHARPSWRR